MTSREEAIKFLELEKESTKMLWDSMNHKGGIEYFEKTLEVLDMAIEALKTQPCKDCISREAVIEWLRDQDFIKMKWQEENARRELAKLSSVQPKKIYMVCYQCPYHKYPSYEKCRECGASMEVEDEKEN